jgi:hypothetical protein
MITTHQITAIPRDKADGSSVDFILPNHQRFGNWSHNHQQKRSQRERTLPFGFNTTGG